VGKLLRELAPTCPNSHISAGPLPVVQADPTLMGQVFSNLIGNALKFSARQSAPRVEIGMQEGPDGIEIFVRDNGVGFDAAQLDKLFAPFQRLHRAEDFAGTGVGLSIVKRLIERHGGRIRAESTPGERTTFAFTLGPAALAHPHEDNAGHSMQSPAPLLATAPSPFVNLIAARTRP